MTSNWVGRPSLAWNPAGLARRAGRCTKSRASSQSAIRQHVLACVDLSTGQCWVVLNAHAWRDAPTEGLRNLLEYVSKRKAPAGSPDPLVARIDAEVERANRDAEWRAEAMGFMTLEQHYRAREQYAEEQGIEQGLEQGQAIGEARYGRLVEALLAESRLEDLRKASEDAGYRHGLYEELGI